MVTLNKMNGDKPEIRHNLVPKFEDKLFPKDGMWCYIQAMSSGKYSVFPTSVVAERTFYRVFETIEDVHENFEEVPLFPLGK